jgi:predicted CXXCH cytochrome family protein
MLATSAFSADPRSVPVLYPKDNSVVGSKVNVVLDPAEVPFFRITVNKTPHPVIDTSQGAHAYQGLVLEPGTNSITVDVLAPPQVQDKNKKETQAVTASRTIKVFNADGAFGETPSGFSRDPFHTRERESACADCHRLEVSKQDQVFAKPEDVLCFVCHREMPKGRHIHGPAAVWNCLACHNPELYPVKYSFSAVDPWKVTKFTQTVEPMVFTLSSAGLFNAGSAVLVSKARARKLLAEVLAYLQQNPADKLRLEVHTDSTPLKQQKMKNGKIKGFKDNRSLTAARARTLTALFKEAGVGEKRVLAVGMGEKMPKSANSTAEGKELNNRIEMVVYPSDVKVLNSQKLPVLKDRERVVVTLTYSKGPQLRKLRVVERVPKGMRYVKGSGFLKGRPTEPKVTGAELVWVFGDMNANFNETLYFTLKKGTNQAAIPPVTRVAYRAFDREQFRVFDPKTPAQLGSTVAETCQKCHPGMTDGKFKHGPVDSGYCTLCHDAHASSNSAWLRKPVWDLCSTCHPDQGNGIHVVAGYIKSFSHPTKGKKDQARPGKSLSCSSCHDPHKGEHEYFFAYDLNNRFDLCKRCHKK